MKFFDLHTHASPDLYQRRYTVDSLEKELIESDSFAVFKSHINSTVPLTLNSKRMFGSIVLNEFQGGLKLPPVVSQFIMSQKPFIIWMPTLTGYVSPSIKQKKFHSALDFDYPRNQISINEKLKSNVVDILKFAGENDIPVASGHSSKKEVELLLCEAMKFNVRLIVTHPFYKLTNFSVEELYRMSKRYSNIYFECNILMNLINKGTIKRDIELIDAVGQDRVFIASDLGQTNRMTVSDGYDYYFNKLTSYSNLSQNIYNDIFYFTPQKILFGERKI